MYVSHFLRTEPDSESALSESWLLPVQCALYVCVRVGVQRGEVNDEVFTKLLALMRDLSSCLSPRKRREGSWVEGEGHANNRACC